MGRRTAWALFVLLAVVAACGRTAPPPPSPTEPPAPEPPDANAVGVLHTGHASLSFTGDLEGTRRLEWELMTADASFTALTWGSGIATLDLYAGPGRLAEGTHRSGPDLGIQLRLGDDRHTFVSGATDCRITFSTVTEERVAGRVRCSGVPAMKGSRVIDLQGAFEAAH